MKDQTNSRRTTAAAGIQDKSGIELKRHGEWNYTPVDIFLLYWIFYLSFSQGKLKAIKPPCESDFQTIKLISNGAYGWEYFYSLSNYSEITQNQCVNISLSFWSQSCVFSQTQRDAAALCYEEDQQTKPDPEEPDPAGVRGAGHPDLRWEPLRGQHVLLFWDTPSPVYGYGVCGG